MLTIDSGNSLLLLIDFQERLMPAIADATQVVANARRLLGAASLLGVPVLQTEQYSRGLGHTVQELALPAGNTVIEKMEFNACLNPSVFNALLADQRDVIVCGCEAHVCVLQSVLGLIYMKRRVIVVADAIGSRKVGSRDVALRRMGSHAAEIVTTEMVIFEWLASASHPRFKDVMALIK